jgi:hypothetical protein
MLLKLKSYFYPSPLLETEPKNSIVEKPVIARYQFQLLKPIMTKKSAESRMQRKLIKELFCL